jgi:tRNA(fMet)-specific endonuclease VapC
MIYLLDTDTVILLMRGLSIAAPRSEKQRESQRNGRRVFETCRKHAAMGNMIGLSAITIAELEFGACGATDPEAERARMKRFLSPFAQFDFGAGEPSHQYGIVRKALESKGLRIGANDLLIAAHAKALGAVLVTHNVREFKRISDLKCENWAR